MDIALVTGDDPGAPPPGTVDPEAGVDMTLRSALAARGVSIHRPHWRDRTVDWAQFDLAVVRTVWDYQERRDVFVAWAEATAARVPLENPADVLRWNTHKGYLMELEERGAPIVPTAWLARGDRADVAALAQARGWSEIVVKPAVGAGSRGTERFDADGIGSGTAQAHLDALLADGDALVQPFRRRITDGELSLVVIEGRVTHAVRKRPAAGEFRIQGRFGGEYAREVPDAATVALAEWIVDAVGTSLLFARVDLVEADDGTLELSELEATEPDLYLALSEEGTERLADAIVRRAGGSGGVPGREGHA